MTQAVQLIYDPDYILYSDGRLYSKLRKKFMALSFNKRSRKEMSKNHYPKFIIKGHRSFAVHRLLAEHFLPKVKGKTFVLHKNDDPLDFQLSNLQWGSQSENMQQYWDRKKEQAVG